MRNQVNSLLQIPKTFQVKTSHYLIGGLSLVAALSWNDTIKKAINTVYPVERDQVSANIIYSLVITMLLIFIIYLLPDTTTELPDKTQKALHKAKKQDQLDRIERAVHING